MLDVIFMPLGLVMRSFGLRSKNHKEVVTWDMARTKRAVAA